MAKKPCGKAKKKKDIILKTAGLLKDRSFQHITVRMICKAAQISIGTFYHYFRRKENVASDIFGLTDEFIEEKLLPALTDDDELTNIVNFCSGIANFAEEQGVPYSRALNSLFPEREVYTLSMERQRPIFFELQKIIQHGIDKKQIDPSHSAERLADSFVLLLHGLDFDWARREGEYGLTEKTRFIMAQMIELLRRPSVDPSIYRNLL